MILSSEAIDPRLDSALLGFDYEPAPQQWPDTLPLLERLKSEGTRSGSPIPFCRFDDVHVLFIQHHLGPLVPRIAAMQDQGLSTDRAWFVDVPYSTNQEVRTHVAGLAGDRLAPAFNDPLAEYAPAQLKRVEQAVQRIASALDDDERLLVIDDGAYFTRVLHQRRSDKNLLDRFRGRTHIVEQTTRGHRLIFDDIASDEPTAVHPRQVLEQIGAPVVSIARCQTKTKFEGPVIGAALWKAAVSSLARQDVDLTKLERIGVIGFGTVGRAIFGRLRKMLPGATIDVIETADEKHSEIRALGGRALSRVADGGGYQVLFGCTGYDSFTLDDRPYLAEKATLVSCSSAAVEFNRHLFVEEADRVSDDEIEIVSPERGSTDIRATIVFEDGDRTIDFLHAGFPINFDGEIEHIPYELIQATHTLLFAAAMETLALDGPTFQTIAPATDIWVLDHALDLISEGRN